MIQRFVKTHIVFIICLVLPAIASIISHLNFIDYLSFVTVLFFCLYVPGLAIYKLLKLDENNSLVKSLTSFAIGYSLSIIIYIIFLSVSIQHRIIFIYPIISLLSIWYILKRKDFPQQPKPTNKEGFIFGAFLVVATCIGIVAFQYQNLLPTCQNEVNYNQDLMFWCRNCVAATKYYPLPDLSILNKSLHYHYFSSIGIGFLHFMTGIEIFNLCFTYSFLITIFLFTSGLYVLLKEMIENEKLIFIAMCFILFTSSLEDLTHIYFSIHLYKVSFGYAEGMALFCFTLTYFLKWCKSEKHELSIAFLSICFMLVCTGLKAPLAAVLLVGIGVGCILLIFKRHNFWRVSMVGISYLLVFILVLGLFVMGSKSGVEGSSSRLSLSLTDTIFHSHYYDILYHGMYKIIHFKIVAYLLTLLLYLFSSMLIPLIVFGISIKKGGKRINDIDLIYFTMIICGILLGTFVSHQGMSQMYYLFVSILCIFTLGFSLYSRNREIKNSEYSKLYLLLFLGIFLFLPNIIKASSYGIKEKLSSLPIVKTNRTIVEKSGTSISIEEINGLRWCKKNIDDNAIVLSNKVLADRGSRSFLTSSFTERQTYLESYAYSNVSQPVINDRLEKVNFFYSGNKQIYNILKKEGVTHAVVYKHIQPNAFPEQCKTIFENKDILVLEL